MKSNADRITTYINRAIDLAITDAVSNALSTERRRIKLEIKAAQLDKTNTVPLEDVLQIVDNQLELI